jgi:7-cyano-7-deazaguanine synthase
VSGGGTRGPGGSVACLSSGGLDSGVLLADLAARYRDVHPLYVRCGLLWEDEEEAALLAFCRALRAGAIRPPAALELPMRDVYGKAWYASGRGIPGSSEPDGAWEIPGRNVVLLSKAAVWCRLNGVGVLSIGTLRGNPFPDAGADFFRKMEAALSSGLAAPIELLRPLSSLDKADVIRLGRSLPLELTLSCAAPRGSVHCGACGKCAERQRGFAAAGVPDPTRYASGASLA